MENLIRLKKENKMKKKYVSLNELVNEVNVMERIEIRLMDIILKRFVKNNK